MDCNLSDCCISRLCILKEERFEVEARKRVIENLICCFCVVGTRKLCIFKKLGVEVEVWEFKDSALRFVVKWFGVVIKYFLSLCCVDTFHEVKSKRERRKENKALTMELLAVAYSSLAAKMEEIIYRLVLLEFSATQKYSLASNSTCNVEGVGDL
ncbi:uncharacterized protein LOC133719366 [Rosa rugosa]|uniref:uncharacterized protein LOC133719366 n=1 Tax=Rosa rugosa TaxID=74645 RepID=UPI002B40F275|nr:uncharacterized protein LOC133719366 [Rosa rugosa]